MTTLWELESNPAAIAAAANAWSSASSVWSNAANTLASASSRALQDWVGETAESYDTHRRDLQATFDAAADICLACRRVLTATASELTATQGRLDVSWASVRHIKRSNRSGGVLFQPATPEEKRLVSLAVTTATQERHALDARLAKLEAEFQVLQGQWTQFVNQWQPVADGKAVPIKNIPPQGGQVGILVTGNEAVFSAGDSDDQVVVTTDPNTGEQTLVHNKRVWNPTLEKWEYVYDRSYRIPAGLDLTIRGGGGRDEIILPAEADIRFRVIGGSGGDRIVGSSGNDDLFGAGGDDAIEAGAGSDFVSGGAGLDYLDGQSGNDRLVGGSGQDTLYGSDGRDTLSAGSGDDFLEGGAGDDTLLAADGNDIVSGGRGDDRMFGGRGDDQFFGGLGRDQTVGGDGHDTSRDDLAADGSSAESTTTIEIPDTTSWIKIEGSDEFVARVQSDLDFLNQTENGRAMLERLRFNFLKLNVEGGMWDILNGNPAETLKISEYSPEIFDERNSFAQWDNTVLYQPSIDDFRGAPPVVVLQHELAHIYDFTSDNFNSSDYVGADPIDAAPLRDGTHIRVGERQAAGLPIDHDNDPATPEIIDPNHPFEITENGLRDELKLKPRDHYQ